AFHVVQVIRHLHAAGGAIVVVTLQSELVVRRSRGIEAKSPAAFAPRVAGRLAVDEVLMVAVEIGAVDPEINVGPQRSTVTDRAKIAQLAAAAAVHVPALRVLRAFGNDIDDAIDRVRAPKRAAR